MLVSEEFGGIECDAQTYVKVIEQLAKDDASVAWCTFIYFAFSILSAYFPPDVACELFSPDTVKMCGAYAPTGRATRTFEHGVSGFRVSGKWACVSGATNADLIMAGYLITAQPELLRNGNVGMQSILFKKQQVKLMDNWTAFGLKGTGSGELEVVVSLYLNTTAPVFSRTGKVTGRCINFRFLGCWVWVWVWASPA